MSYIKMAEKIVTPVRQTGFRHTKEGNHFIYEKLSDALALLVRYWEYQWP